VSKHINNVIALSMNSTMGGITTTK